MTRSKIYLIVAVSLVLSVALLNAVALASGGPSQLSQALQYLKSTQKADGSWGGSTTSLNGVFPTTATALQALVGAENSTSSNQLNAIQYLGSQNIDETPLTAQRIIALPGDTSADTNALLSRQNSDGGWGITGDFQSDNLDTSFALLGLSAGKPNISVVYQAVFYLLNRQNADGGWPLTQGEDSQIYYTAMALQALNAARFPYPTSLSQNSAVSYLRSQQNADGGYG